MSFWKRRKLKNQLEIAQLQARLNAINRYSGADRDSRTMRAWDTYQNDANGDLLPDLPALRERSRDLEQNNPIAKAVFNTKTSNVIGRGLTYQSLVDREFLGLTDEQAEAFNVQKEREWSRFWESVSVDVCQQLNGHMLLEQIYKQFLVNGESLVIVRQGDTSVKRPYRTCFQVVEPDQLCNPNDNMDTPTLAGGVGTDSNGRPIRYHFLSQHPGVMTGAVKEWVSIESVGEKTGLRKVIHVYRKTRPGQSRGVPDLHAVIEPLRLLGEYTKAELMRSVVNTLVALVIQTPEGNPDVDFDRLTDETGQTKTDKDMKLTAGAVLALAKGETAMAFDPKAPNSAYEGFFAASLKQVGMGVNIPFEILLKMFSTSYTASKAARLEFWRWVVAERRFLVDIAMADIHDWFMYEAVTTGRINAPGYFSDANIRAAYDKYEFRGPTQGHLNETDEIDAAVKRIDNGLSTLAAETAELTGGDWAVNHKQLAFERKKRVEDGLFESMPNNNK